MGSYVGPAVITAFLPANGRVKKKFEEIENVKQFYFCSNK